jgi:hypothetical protein
MNKEIVPSGLNLSPGGSPQIGRHCGVASPVESYFFGRLL